MSFASPPLPNFSWQSEPKAAARTTAVSRQRLRLSVTPSKTYAQPEPTAVGCKWGTNASTVTTFSGCMTTVFSFAQIFGRLSVRAAAMGPPPVQKLRASKGPPTFKKPSKAWALAMMLTGVVKR